MPLFFYGNVSVTFSFATLEMLAGCGFGAFDNVFVNVVRQLVTAGWRVARGGANEPPTTFS